MVAFQIAPPTVGDTAMSPICMAPASPCIRPWYAGSAVFIICSTAGHGCESTAWREMVVHKRSSENAGRLCESGCLKKDLRLFFTSFSGNRFTQLHKRLSEKSLTKKVVCVCK